VKSRGPVLMVGDSLTTHHRSRLRMSRYRTAAHSEQPRSCYFWGTRLPQCSYYRLLAKALQLMRRNLWLAVFRLVQRSVRHFGLSAEYAMPMITL
jgi:hypothetical protein